MAELFKIHEATGKKRANVVFFHGLGGDAKRTWQATKDQASFWPAWLADIEGVSVYSIGYKAPVSRWCGTAMHLTNRATNVLDRLLAEPALANGPMILIGHSLGGLIIKQLLRTAESDAFGRQDAADFLRRVAKIAFFATPHSGSGVATCADRLRILFRPSAAAACLVRNDPNLCNLNKWYHGWATLPNYQHIAHLVLAENEPVRVLGMIVKPDSADPFLPNETFVLMDADHFSICKPSNTECHIYKTVRSFIEQGVERKKDLLPAIAEGQDRIEERIEIIFARLSRLELGSGGGTNIVHAELVALEQGSEVNFNNRRDHVSFFVMLKSPHAFFFAQARQYSVQTLSLRTDYCREWLNVDCPTIPMWWDDHRRRVLWANPLTFLFRIGGLGSGNHATFNKDKDLRVLDRYCRGEFVRRVRQLCAFWPHRRSNAGLNADNFEYPINFVDAIEDPEILRYLPLSGRLIGLLRDYDKVRFAERLPPHMGVLRVARQGLHSLDRAARELLQMYGIPEEDREFLRSVKASLRAWRERIPTGNRITTAKTLRAFDQLLSIVGYRQQGDLKFPDFSSDSTYPIGNLAGLLPHSVLSNPLVRILDSDNDYKVLQHAAWLIGVINFPSGSEAWDTVRLLRKKLERRKSEIGEFWPLVDRQLLYAEVQLGSNQARLEYLKRLRIDDVGQFEAAYNHLYYGGDLGLIKFRFERRLDEGGLRTDQNVLEILSRIYENHRRWIARPKNSGIILLPHLWSAD